MLTLWFGHEDRAEVGTTVFIKSVIDRAKTPVAIVPITRLSTGAFKEGTNAFTFRRFLVPWAMNYIGQAVFVDGADMLCRADINEIVSEASLSNAVSVVKHRYRTKHRRKYCRTAMEAANVDYERKQWASVMVINCAHFAWRKVDPEFVMKTPALDLLQLKFIPDDRIGELPIVWNWLADEHGVNPDAKLIHFTAGIPAFDYYRHSPMSDEWHQTLKDATRATG
jgi:hypothetical protein